MKRISLVVLFMLLGPPLFADAGQQLIPAGSLVSCTRRRKNLLKNNRRRRSGAVQG